MPGVTTTGCASLNAPLASVTADALSAASAAVEVTVAVVEARYSLATPGVKAPKETGAPSESDSVAGTSPPTGAVTRGVTRIEPVSCDAVRTSWPRYSATTVRSPRRRDRGR